MFSKYNLKRKNSYEIEVVYNEGDTGNSSLNKYDSGRARWTG